MKNSTQNKRKNRELFFFISLVFFVIIVIPGWVYVALNWSWIEVGEKNNEIGDAVGGITNPIIGIGGIILTFFAFYVQYSFNIKQTEFYKLDKIDRKTEEFAKYLDKLSFVEGPINSSILIIVDRASTLFSIIDLSQKKNKFSFEKDSIEEIFLSIVHLNADFNKYELSINKKNTIPGGEHLNKIIIEEQVHRKLQVYLKFCKFLNLLQKDFEHSKIPDDVTERTIVGYLMKFEFCYPMYSHKMSTLFILYYTMQLKNKKNSKIIFEYYRNVPYFNNIIEALEYSMKVYIKKP